MILPLDQGFEHGPGRSFAMNPTAYNPRYHFALAIEAGCRAYAAPLGFLEAIHGPVIQGSTTSCSHAWNQAKRQEGGSSSSSALSAAGTSRRRAGSSPGSVTTTS